MDEKEVRMLCEAAQLDDDGGELAGLGVMEEMMESVVRSGLCVECPRETAPVPAEELRKDRPVSAYTREEMLAGVSRRRDEYALVPRVV